MADTIARLRLNSDDFDSKIKRAVTGLQQMEDECRKVGGTLAILEKDQLDYVKALGQMQTVATTTKGKLAELTNAYTELRVQYNRLTDEEKKGDFGKALSSSLDQLKTRIESTRNELSNIGKELGNTNGAGQQSTSMLDQLAQRFTINIDALKLFDMGLKAANVALDTVKGAVESTEATHDAFARTIAVTDNITNQFLRTLATADFSSFVSGLQSVIDKTIEAYNAMDEFESYAARFQPWQTAKEGEISTKLQQARAAKAQGDSKRAEQLNNEAKQLINELESATKAYGEKQTKGGFDTIRSLMGTVDINDQQIAWYANPKNWEAAKKKAEEYKKVQEEIDRLAQSNITAPSYDQTTRRENKQRIEQLNKQLEADPSLKRAYTMMNLRDSGDSNQAQALRRALGDIYGNTMAESRIQSLRARADRMDGVLTRGGTGSASATPKDTAAKAVQDAELAYSQAIEKARMSLENGMTTEAEAKKKTLSAEESLWTAYGKAYATYADPKYKEAQDTTAGRIKELGGEVSKLIEAQKVAQQAARDLEAAQKKLSEAEDKMAVAMASNDLKTYNAAKRQAVTAQAEVERIQKVVTVEVEAGKEDLPDVPKEITQRVNVETGEISLPEIPADVKQTVNVETGEIDIPELPAYMEIKANVKPGTTELPELPENENVPVNFTLTDDNLNAFIADLKTRIGDSEVGTTLYNALTAQLADAQMLGDFISLALKNGVDLAEFDVQGLFAKIFGDGTEAGDYIKDVVWENMIAALEEQTGERFSSDMKEGKITEDKGDDSSGLEKTQATISAISSLTNGLQQIGVTIPKEVTGVINAVQGLITVIQAANAIIHLFTTGTSAAQVATTTSNTVAVGALTASIGGLIAAIETNTFSNFLFAGGGIVPHAAGGFIIPGNDHADMTPIFAQSGELILNKAQQGALASELQTAESGGQAVGTPYTTGEVIFLGVNNYLRREGLGEIVTTNMR